MTDKQIIFGVDVSKCPYAEPAYGSPKCRINGYVHCDGFRNCEYKQLKRKKQRIVELNKTIKAKEQECEELKKDVIEALKLVEITSTHNTFQETKINRLSKTLTEIKKIAEGVKVYDPLAKQILQKISEVE